MINSLEIFTNLPRLKPDTLFSHFTEAIPIRLASNIPIFPLNLPLETVTLLAKEDDFNPEGNTITAFPPFFTSREPDPDPFVAGGKNKLKPTQPSPYLIPYLLHFRPSVQTGREKQAAVLLVVEIDDLCISLARNFLRIAEDPFSIQNEILYFIESS